MNQGLLQNDIKKKLKNKGKVSAAWLQLGSNISAEVVANAGFDILYLDAEHSPIGFTDMISINQAIKGTGGIPFARAPWNDMVTLKRMLDTGLMGIHIPYVCTKAEAEAAVKYCKYPPVGLRGIAGSPRAPGYGRNLGSYLQRINDELVIIVAIETPEAVNNIEEICSVEGVDGIFIGPMDLSTSMGQMGNLSHPDVAAAIGKVEKAVFASDKFLATVANGMEHAKTLYDKGYNLLVMFSDATDLGKAAVATINQFREYIGEK